MILIRSRLVNAASVPLRTLLLWLVFINSCSGPQIPEAVPLEDVNSSSNDASVVVEVVVPQRKDLLRQITLSGTIEPFQRARLHSKVAGYLEWIGVDIGDRVAKGQVLAKLEVPEMADQYSTAEAELGIVEADRTHAEAELERARADLQLKKLTYTRLQGVASEEPDMVPLQRVDEARAEYQLGEATVKVLESRIRQVESQMKRVLASLEGLKTLMSYTEIKAPFRGRVTERHVDPGTLIQAASSSQNAQPVATIASTDVLRVFVDVPEAEVPFVEQGDRALIKVPALPSHTFEARITRFTGALNPATRTMRTEIDIPNPGNILKPGMYGAVTLTLEERPQAITLPSRALHTAGHKKFTYSVVESRLRKIEVETGLDDGITVEITKGLEGDEIVVLATRGEVQGRDGSGSTESPGQRVERENP